MQAEIFIPKSKRLRQYVEYFWLLIDGAGNEPDIPILPPEAAFDMVLSLGSPTVWQTGQHRTVELKDSFLGGIRSQPFFIQRRSHIECLAIRFYPNSLYPFLDFPLIVYFLHYIVHPLWYDVFVEYVS